MQQQMLAQQMSGQAAAGGTPPAERPGQQLANGAPVTNHFQPSKGLSG
jgi:hypothetical protein